MKKISMLLIISAFYALEALERWHSPQKHLRYHEVCFLTSHNSYAAHRHGYWYAQQTWTIAEQLAAGVRGLMLDLHEESDHSIILCHGNPFITKCIRSGKSHMSFHEALKTIRSFLKAHDKEIVTIFLENYVRDTQTLDNAFLEAQLETSILSPADWNPVEKNGWPSIEWMQKQNKRLIIFNPKEQTAYTYNQWQHVVENQWGAIYPMRACKERSESKKWRSHPRYLYCVNSFPRLKFTWDNSYAYFNSTGLDILLKKLTHGLDSSYCRDRLPNFISIDFVNEGDGMKRVNLINKKAHNPEIRKRCFYAVQAV